MSDNEDALIPTSQRISYYASGTHLYVLHVVAGVVVPCLL